MSEFTEVMSTLSRRLSSGNSVPMESARITKTEFEIISNEVENITSGTYVSADVSQKLYEALIVAKRSLETYGAHPIIEDRINKALLRADQGFFYERN